ncbi:MAG: CapA family protein, partial [Melioribacteraceae bacterium]|nr:CapA family protein [Melioribacteraceae bacterium]
IKYSGYPVFNTPEEFLEGLKYAGFDILVTANNHAFDQKEVGVLNTLDNINKNGMMSSGTFYSHEDRDSIRIYNHENFNFALLSYSYGVNRYKIPGDKKYLVNIIDTALIREDINLVKEKEIDLVIVYFQFGGEYEREPNKYQKEIVKRTISYGADIILGAHPHVLQPIEQFKTVNGNIDSGFVAYSLGNFISNQRWRYSDGGTILNFTLDKNLNSGKVELASVEYLPIWVFKGKTENGYEYIILPSELSQKDSLPNYLTEKDIELMNQCYEDTKAILEKNYSGIKKQHLN